MKMLTIHSKRKGCHVLFTLMTMVTIPTSAFQMKNGILEYCCNYVYNTKPL